MANEKQLDSQCSESESYHVDNDNPAWGALMFRFMSHEQVYTLLQLAASHRVTSEQLRIFVIMGTCRWYQDALPYLGVSSAPLFHWGTTMQ